MKAPEIYRVRKPCSPGYAGKWCVASYHVGGVSFWYFNTKREARAAYPNAIEVKP